MTIDGNATPGSVIRVYEGATLIGSTVTGANGAFTVLANNPLTDGTHDLTAQATDNDRAASAARSSVLAVTVGHAPPGGHLYRDRDPLCGWRRSGRHRFDAHPRGR